MCVFFCFKETATTEIYTLSLHDALPIFLNAPVDENEFNFVPPDKVFPVDVTPKYIQQIRDAATRDDNRN